MSRYIQHLSQVGVSIGVEVKEGKAKVALAACNEKDHFSRRDARTVLHHRLSGKELFGVKTSKFVFEFPYTGNTPRKDILHRFADQIRDNLGFTFDKTFGDYVPPGSNWVLSKEDDTVMEMMIPTTPPRRSINGIFNRIRKSVESTIGQLS